jgi:hypothetical protein
VAREHAERFCKKPHSINRLEISSEILRCSLPTPKYGKHTVFLGSSFAAMQGSQHTGERAELPRRQTMLLKGEGKRRRLGIPMLGEVR